MGGEEFVIFLYDVDYLISISQRVVESVFDFVISYNDIKIKTSISAGLAWSNKTKTFEVLYEHADGLLYESKMTGKNKLSAKEL